MNYEDLNDIFKPLVVSLVVSLLALLFVIKVFLFLAFN